MVPSHARVVVVGGGIVGCSVAYHLAKLGWRDVVLLEQTELAGGTTWHAAGMVGRLRTNNSLTQINHASVELYKSLQAETGHDTGWMQVGSLIVGRTPERMVQIRRSVAMAEYFGVEASIITPSEAGEKWPLMHTDDVLGAAWLPGDGKVIPKETATALAIGARQHGATVVEGVRVTGITRRGGRARGVETDRGDIEAEYVVLCSGMWTRELALRAGVNIPLYPVEHHYAVSNPIEGAFDELPCARDPDACIYFRGEGNAVLLGAFQPYSKPWMVDRVPDEFSFKLLEDDWEKFAEPLAAGRHRIPALKDSGFARFVNGPESFTPDNNFIMGESPELAGLFVGAGFNSVGIACAGGAGMVLAQWIAGGEPPMDLWSVDIRRFAPFHNNRAFLRDRVSEVLGLHYQMAWPNREFETGRGLRRSALHDRLERAGACFTSKMGLERPAWFARDGIEPVNEYSFGRQNWFGCHAAEHMAARERVAVFDQTSFSKYILKGPGALSVLQRLCGNDIDVPVDTAVYTGMFNERGTFESDLSVIRIADDEFYLVTATGQLVRDFHWISGHIGDAACELVDITPSRTVLGVMGPASRDLLSRLTETDLSLDGFPFGTSRVMSVGRVTVRAVRITYVGELGWELHVPADQAPALYDCVMEAGTDLGVTNAGHTAINSLRIEKGYRAWGAELSPDDTPLEAGLAFALAWDKPVPFIGRDALLAHKELGIRKRLVSFLLADPEPVLWGGEPIYRDDRCVGYTTSGSYGHAVGGAVGLGYVRRDQAIDKAYITSGEYQIDIAGTRFAARASLAPLYDPKRARILV